MSGFTINRTVQSGNLTRDPELRSLPSGTSVCNLGIAVNERYKDSATGEWSDRANFFNWTVWGGIGEWVAKNLEKGDSVTLEGRARWHDWEDSQGNKRSAVDFVADSIVPQRSGGGGGSERQQRREEQAAGSDFQARDSGFTGRSDVTPDTAAEDFKAAGSRTATKPPPEDDDIPF